MKDLPRLFPVGSDDTGSLVAVRFRAFLLILVLLVVLAACDDTVPLANPATGATGSAPGTTASTPGTDSPTSGQLPSGAEDLPEPMQDDLRSLISETEEIRGLGFERLPSVELLNPQQLRRRVRSIVREELGDVTADQALYDLLGLIPPDANLRQEVLDLYGDQVAGFYDGETRSLVVATGNAEFTERERATLVHELTHALTDQHFSFDATNRELVDTAQYDAATAYLTLIEGDAVNIEYDYVASLPQNRLDLYYEEIMGVDTAAWESAPAYLRESLSFPYIQGEVFVSELIDTGGYQAVNDAYGAVDLSTEQVIRTRDFGRDLPVEVDVMDVSVPGYTEATRSTWGELGFRLLLGQYLEEEVAARAAEGWGGDSYRQLSDDSGEAVLLLEYQGDTPRDAAELSDALGAYAVAALDTGEAEGEGGTVIHRGEDNIFVRRQDARVTWVMASSPTAFETVVEAVTR